MSVTVISKILQSVSATRYVDPRSALSRFKPILMATAVVIGAISQSGTAFALEPTPLVSAQCSTNPVSDVQDVYYVNTPPAPGTPTQKTLSIPMNNPASTMKPYWDFRYVNFLVNSVSQTSPQSVATTSTYANHLNYSGIDSTSSQQAKGWGTPASTYDTSGSLVQAKCVNGYLVASAMVNGWDSLQVSTYGGPHATWTYQFTEGHTGLDNAPAPWSSSSGYLMLQGLFMQPYHTKEVVGAEVNFNVFLAEKNHPEHALNYVISVYRSNNNFSEGGMQTDPSNGATPYVSTLVAHGTQWVTQSPLINTTPQPQASVAIAMTDVTRSESWPNFYRVNISYADLSKALIYLKDFKILINDQYVYPYAAYGQNPAGWIVTNVAVQTEFTGTYPYYQSVGSSVRAFEVYSYSNALPL